MADPARTGGRLDERTLRPGMREPRAEPATALDQIAAAQPAPFAVRGTGREPTLGTVFPDAALDENDEPAVLRRRAAATAAPADAAGKANASATTRAPAKVPAGDRLQTWRNNVAGYAADLWHELWLALGELFAWLRRLSGKRNAFVRAAGALAHTAQRRIRKLVAAVGVVGVLAIGLLTVPRVNDAVISRGVWPRNAIAYDTLDQKDKLGISSTLLENKRNDPEARIVRVLMKVSAGELEAAHKDVDALIADTPNFRLAHLVKGDLLLARAHPLKSIGSITDIAPAGVRELEEEARVRLRRYTESLASTAQMPRYLLQMGAHQEHAIVVDAKRSRLFVYENRDGVVRLIDDYYVTIGKNGPEKNREGDQRTPVGVYEVTDTLTPERLTDFYGSGAFPINYPNAWDLRAKRSGSGIWLHGVPSDTYSRPPRASNGCVVLSNSDLVALRPYLKPGVTPVVIADKLEWANADEVVRNRGELQRAVEQWRLDWESRDLQRYAQHYHDSFRADGRGLEAWIEHKRGTTAGKAWIKVQLGNVSIFGYPGNDKLSVVSFDQDYRSNNYESNARKRQYWLREGSNWRIVYEGLDS